jgi:hypothetical protein
MLWVACGTVHSGVQTTPLCMLACLQSQHCTCVCWHVRELSTAPCGFDMCPTIDTPQAPQTGMCAPDVLHVGSQQMASDLDFCQDVRCMILQRIYLYLQRWRVVQNSKTSVSLTFPTTA